MKFIISFIILNLLFLQFSQAQKPVRDLIMSCNLGKASSCMNLGDGLVSSQFDRARYFYKKSCFANNMKACRKLGELEKQAGRLNKSKEFFKRACKGGEKDLCATSAINSNPKKSTEKNPIVNKSKIIKKDLNKITVKTRRLTKKISAAESADLLDFNNQKQTKTQDQDNGSLNLAPLSSDKNFYSTNNLSEDKTSSDLLDLEDNESSLIKIKMKKKKKIVSKNIRKKYLRTSKKKPRPSKSKRLKTPSVSLPLVASIKSIKTNPKTKSCDEGSCFILGSLAEDKRNMLGAKNLFQKSCKLGNKKACKAYISLVNKVFKNQFLNKSEDKNRIVATSGSVKVEKSFLSDKIINIGVVALAILFGFLGLSLIFGSRLINHFGRKS